tara:strand:- start:8167 stop:9483 length:1317 start_codon:yes stop_codon:yes gene_type:complete
MYLPQEIIATKRDGKRLSKNQIQHFIDGIVQGDFFDYQASALLMAIVLNGMDSEETTALTEAMLHSGRIEKLDTIKRPKIDKHSTGGVGDKVSILLAPLMASAGLCVPMMSGRGLGHTGGTLDKLESIPGFNINLEQSVYQEQLAKIHQAMIGQSPDIVPADQILYSLRDVTGTVESIPLICASILSKKLAEGIDALVLDVKCGSGAFMTNESNARELAHALVGISKSMGKPASAILTRMNEPLGCAIGNSLEVIESISCLCGEGPKDLMQVTYALGAEMLRLGGICEEQKEAYQLMQNKIASGEALYAFRQLVHAQGGSTEVVDDISLFARSKHSHSYKFNGDKPAYISEIHAKYMGEAARLLGAGRSHAKEVIDSTVGIYLNCKVGDRIEPGESICRVDYNDTKKLVHALDRIEKSLSYATEEVVLDDVIIDRIID